MYVRAVSAVPPHFFHTCYVREHLGKMDSCEVYDTFGMRHLLKILIAIISLFLSYHPRDGILESAPGVAIYI